MRSAVLFRFFLIAGALLAVAGVASLVRGGSLVSISVFSPLIFAATSIGIAFVKRPLRVSPGGDSGERRAVAPAQARSPEDRFFAPEAMVAWIGVSMGIAATQLFAPNAMVRPTPVTVALVVVPVLAVAFFSWMLVGSLRKRRRRERELPGESGQSS
jgi:membrane protein implicated in regulation of membrane protease activity